MKSAKKKPIDNSKTNDICYDLNESHMKDVKKKLIENFKIYDKCYDFMGYGFSCVMDLTFHHLIVPTKNFNIPHENGLLKWDGTIYVSEEPYSEDGYDYWNGAILGGDTSHKYLHIIERYDFNRFLDITNEMIEEKEKGFLDPKNLDRIDLLLKEFEEQWEKEKISKDEYLIKDEYRKRLKR